MSPRTPYAMGPEGRDGPGLPQSSLPSYMILHVLGGMATGGERVRTRTRDGI
jgi:hypothetical protein